MAGIVLNNYSDDSRIKQYIQQNLMSRVFHDIPMNVLNTGAFSIINEYISQATEQMAFTSTFYFNESFITKAVLPDSIYAEAAIFNIGYGFATPSTTEILLELRLSELFEHGVLNAQNGLYEFILDKDTKFNLPNGNVYSLDYDILFQWRDIHSADPVEVTSPAWNIQYTNITENVVSVNKRIPYIPYRVTQNWVCLFVKASEYTRTRYQVFNNSTNGIPNQDYLIHIDGHICGFDVTYVDRYGDRTPLDRDHILFIHDDVKDLKPYVHYIMDDSNTIRLMFQMMGNRFHVPGPNSKYEITVYTCHGDSANFTEAPKVQPQVITTTENYPNNAQVMKAAFVIGASLGGTNIGNSELVRRETIEAYNTANVISTDHDIDEWFKTFYFKNIIYPYFFKRRDDPWGRIWSGFLALRDSNNMVYKTNTLHAKISYRTLYENNQNIISSNEVIIPPGWIWIYGDENRYTVIPYTDGNRITVETARTLQSIPRRFVFANPFGIRIQKDPFAIAYFNPWIDLSLKPIRRPGMNVIQPKDANSEDISKVYHGSPIYVDICRTYKDDYYHFETYIDLSQPTTVFGETWVKYLLKNAIPPVIDESLFTYFREPRDINAKSIPLLARASDEGFIPFDPERTFLCVREINELDDDDSYALYDIWIRDVTNPDKELITEVAVPDVRMVCGNGRLWGPNGMRRGVVIGGNTDLYCDGIEDTKGMIEFVRYGTYDYYTLKLRENMYMTNADGDRQQVDVTNVSITVEKSFRTERRKFGESSIYNVGKKYQTVKLNVKISYIFKDAITDADGEVIGFNYGDRGEKTEVYYIRNAVDVCLPYPEDDSPEYKNGIYTFTYPTTNNMLSNEILEPETVIAYATMKASPSTDSVDYYEIPFSELESNPDTVKMAAMFLITDTLPTEENNLRVILHTYLNGAETGRVEMIPVSRDKDGTYLFQADMYPLNELLDIDNLIHIASLDYGGGSWKSAKEGAMVNVDAINPEIRISLLFKSTNNLTRTSDIVEGDEYTGYLMNDQYILTDFSLVQEMKEMRSVVNFYESSIPTDHQLAWYDVLMNFFRESEQEVTMMDLKKTATNQMFYKAVLDDETKQTLAKRSKKIMEDIQQQIDVLVKDDGVLEENAIYDLDVGLELVKLTMNRLSDPTYSELYTYTDDNVLQVYVKEYDIRFAGYMNAYHIYYDFIKTHTEESYAESTDPVIMNRTYLENLLADFVEEYPYDVYEKNFDDFKIYKYPESVYVKSQIAREPIANSIGYETGVLTLLQKTIDLLPYLEEADSELIRSGLTKKSYLKIYKDPGCTVEITSTDYDEDMFFYVKEEHKLDTVLSFDDSGELVVQKDYIIWENIGNLITNYQTLINDVFGYVNVNGGMEIQLVPFVEYSLMNTDQFRDFVHTFTQVHRSLEPVIFKRLEGNHYLDCKLTATYGLPHSYCADKQYFLEGEFWPDLRIQISFDVKLYNRALAANTLSDLRDLVRAYFNRLTTVHSPADLVTMNNNIYVSHLIQRMESHDNVAYMKFNGWYTSERNDKNGNYMSPEVQSIVQKWKTLESMPTDELERYVPEMFVLTDSDIEINVIDDNILA